MASPEILPPPSSPPPPTLPPPPAPYPGYVLVPVVAAPAPPPAKDPTTAVLVIILVLVLVVIPAIGAVVLLGLVGGLPSEHSIVPVAVPLTVTGTAISEDRAVWYANLSIGPLVGGSLTTALVGFDLRNASALVEAQAAPALAQCTGGSVGGCPAPSSGWYLVMEGPGGSPLATFPTSPGGSSWSTGSSSEVPLTEGDLLTVVASSGVGDDTLSTFATGGTPVTGEATL